MIAVAAVLAAFGAVLGAIAGGVAGSHPHYDVLRGGFMVAAYSLFAAAVATLFVLFTASILKTRWRRANRERVALWISRGYDLYWEELAEEEAVPVWIKEVTRWEADVGRQISAYFDQPSLTVFENVVDLQDPGTQMIDALAVNNVHRTRRLRLAERIQNLHRLMAAV